MARILILFAHPALERSRVNRVLIQPAKAIDDVTVRDLYELYPELDISARDEQAALLEHDIIVLHHPFYWYSSPAIIKEWQDLVLVHGWAYGSEGDALRGKTMLNAVTTGGGRDAYQHGGYNQYTMREFMRPFERTARLCGMEYLPPFVAHASHSMTVDAARAHAEEYRRLLIALRDGTLDRRAAATQPRLNEDLDAVIGPKESVSGG